MHYKSQTVQFFLILFLGPMGICYSSIAMGLVMTALAALTVITAQPGAAHWNIIAFLVLAVVNFFVGRAKVKDYNHAIEEKEESRFVRTIASQPETAAEASILQDIANQMKSR